MYKSLLFASFLFSFCVSFAQEVIATQGESYSSSDVQLDFTIGEVVIQTVSAGTTDLTQGFHQTNWKFSGIEDHDPAFAVNVYPNPTSDFLTIQTINYDQLTYLLLDESGRLVAQNALNGEVTVVEVGQLAAGNYSLVLNAPNRPLKTFKLIKSL